jgi:TM2 domain-containing membrane protein YozV
VLGPKLDDRGTIKGCGIRAGQDWAAEQSTIYLSESISTIKQLKSQRHSTQTIAVKHNLVAYLLWLLGGFGVLGLHRFYLGRWVTGLIWLATGGVFLIGAIIDLFLMPEMVQVENLSRQLMQSGLPKPHPNSYGDHRRLTA